MVRYENFQAMCEDKKYVGTAEELKKSGSSKLKVALELARRREYPQDLIEGIENTGMMDGSFDITYEGAERIHNDMRKLLRKKSSGLQSDYEKVIGRLDPARDGGLIASAIFCFSPEIREKVGGDFSRLYRIILSSGASKNRGYALSRPTRIPKTSSDFYPKELRDLLAAIPEPENDEDLQYRSMLKTLVRKKAERDVFPFFRDGEVASLHELERLAKSEVNDTVWEGYNELADSYRKYIDFKLIDVNPDFVDPITGKKGVLPSLHQKIAIYHIVEEERFGVWDDGGTGKTAIAILAQPLIKRKMESEGNEFRRTFIGCPNSGKKAWRKGLLGRDHERYLETELTEDDVMIINGDKKDAGFLEEMLQREWVVANYQQLITNSNGSNNPFVHEFLESQNDPSRGVDYVIFDESQDVKGLREITKTGKYTQSAAARLLSLSSRFYVPTSATPISNGLMDFAVQYHMLNPSALKDPKDFPELIKGSPRILYTFFNEKSVRRSVEDINQDLRWREDEHIVEMGEKQRAIYEHVVSFRPTGWIQQAQKALLDPRLVDPEILKEVGFLGDVRLEDSVKYAKLEELLTGKDGPIANDEKFVVFSTMFRKGVTEAGHDELERKYAKLGVPELYDSLGLDVPLSEFIEGALNRKFERDFEIGTIDGTVLRVSDRENIIDRLGTDLCGIVCTTQTGGVSLDFTPANHTYFLDEGYKPDIIQQALWRQLRKGQKREVKINHLRVDDSLDIDKRDYTDKKRVISKMATDGINPTEEEWSFLEDTEGKKLGDLVRKSIGGRSIDVYDATVDGLLDFEVKKRSRRSRKSGSSVLTSNVYDTTDAQKVARLIGKDPIGCWQDPEFVTLYMGALQNLSPHVVHSAKITDLVSRTLSGDIAFPKKVLSDGSGPSILYKAYNDIGGILKANGLKVPKITDRDLSQAMLDEGENTNQVLGDMRGINSGLKSKSFDMVDNASISLLEYKEHVHETLLESHRLLKDGGLIELVVKNMRFMDSFYSGMEDLGFELISGKNEGFALSKDAFRRIREGHGEHFAESYRSKLSGTHLLLARKVDNPGEVKADDFWFERLSEDEPEITARDPSETNSIVRAGKGRRGGGRSRKSGEGNRKKSSVQVAEPHTSFETGPGGVVENFKRIRGGGE